VGKELDDCEQLRDGEAWRKAVKLDASRQGHGHIDSEGVGAGMPLHLRRGDVAHRAPRQGEEQPARQGRRRW
jgi:hypothetical protein